MTLFIGESAPNSGAFFYFGNTALTRYMAEAMTAAGLYDNSGNFLDRFKSFGWFLDDLVLTPVNQLPKSERTKKCSQAQASFSRRQDCGISTARDRVAHARDQTHRQRGCGCCRQ
jgi:hypothetical protein